MRVSNLTLGLCESEFFLVHFGCDQVRYNKTYAGTEALLPEDIAKTIHWIVNQPPHININSLEIMPVSQTWAGFSVLARDEGRGCRSEGRPVLALELSFPAIPLPWLGSAPPLPLTFPLKGED